MAFNPFWEAPTLILLRLPFFHTEVALFHWLLLRRCVTIPLGHFHSFIGIWRLTSFQPGQWSVLFCTFLCATSFEFAFILPTDVEKVFSAPNLLPKPAPSDMTMLVSPLLLSFPSQQRQSWLEPDTILQFLILVLRGPLPPIS